jgi:histone acetyltransferase
MECCINQQVDYLNLGNLIKRQRAAVMEEIHKISNSHVVYKGLQIFKHLEQDHPKDGAKKEDDSAAGSSSAPSGSPAPSPSVDANAGPLLPVSDIPGVKEAGWTPQRPGTAQQLAATTRTALNAGGYTDLHAKLGAVLKQLKVAKDSWPFLTPVDPKIVPDYYTIITRPMDLEKMTRKLNGFEYKSKEQFHEDAMVMLKNCQTYNTPDTTYYRCAQQMQGLLEKLMLQQFDK